MTNTQIKSKERVQQRGEVFTNEREVKAMCDLVAQECDRIESHFLEPACGNGNFLAEVLTRKLNVVKRKYKKSSYDYERFSVLAIASLYGIDIMNDNATECRQRLYNIWNSEYKKVCKKSCNDQARNAVLYILENNILCGNALSMMQVDENQKDTDQPIIFPDWALVQGTMLKRRDYRLDVLLKADTKPEDGSLKEDDELKKYLSVNPTTGEYMAEPIKEYALTDYRKLVTNISGGQI